MISSDISIDKSLCLSRKDDVREEAKRGLRPPQTKELRTPSPDDDTAPVQLPSFPEMVSLVAQKVLMTKRGEPWGGGAQVFVAVSRFFRATIGCSASSRWSLHYSYKIRSALNRHPSPWSMLINLCGSMVICCLATLVGGAGGLFYQGMGYSKKFGQNCQVCQQFCNRCKPIQDLHH